MHYLYEYRPDLFKLVETIDFQSSASHSIKRPDIDEKLMNNIRRAQTRIEAYALCNHFPLFGTLTLNGKLRNRGDLDSFHTDLCQFIRDQRKKYGCNIQYLIVPELHKKRDGWHMHCLMRGIPEESLQAFQMHSRLPKYIKDGLKDGRILYDWPAYRDRYGWVVFEQVRSQDGAARYMAKYMTKDAVTITAKAIDKGKHLYYASRDLQLPVKIEMSDIAGTIPLPDGLIPGNRYSYDYGSVQWFVKP